MIFNPGELDSEELERRKRFWNKKGFFGTPTKSQLERSSKRMQRLLGAIQNLTIAEIDALRNNRYLDISGLSIDSKCAILNVTESDLRHAITIAPKTFKFKQK